MNITTQEQLRAVYGPAKERSVRKQLDHLDRHCLAYIALSPFVVISSASRALRMDASPRGGAPGFVRAPDAGTLLIPDASGNNRLDTLENIIDTGRIGLLFMVPGVDETLRVNGAATLSTDAGALAHFAGEARKPRLAIRVAVEEAYLHCAKAFMRSALWSEASRIERSRLPSMGEMLHDQIGSGTRETQEEMLTRYAADLAAP